ncbi:MAG: hypothetical protein AAF311_07215 [Pseudomonadota bacterium]
MTGRRSTTHTVSRREMVTGAMTASAAAGTVLALVSPAGSAILPAADRELLDLVDRAMALHRRWNMLADEVDRRSGEALSIRGSSVLEWREETDTRFFLPRPSRDRWMPHHLGQMTRIAEWPGDGTAARAREIKAALEDLIALQGAREDELGIGAMEDELSVIRKDVKRIEDRALVLQPVTLTGLGAIAALLAVYYPELADEDRQDTESDLSEAMTVHLLRSALRLGGMPHTPETFGIFDERRS